ncbi:MORC family CW-type zinc finger protein 3b isoform X1, partial [Tachysurus ichikawai]
QRSPLPLINLTALSDSLKRIKRKVSTAEETAPAVHPMPCASLPPNVLPRGGGIFIHTHSSFAAKNEEGKWDEMENESNANTDNKESFKTARCKSLFKRRMSEEEEEELCDNNEDKWSLQQQQDELVEMMEQTEEDREVCMNELEMLRNHCTALEDERSQLLNKLEKMEEENTSLSSLCDQLKCKMERLKTEKDGRLRENVRNGEERQKLRKLRINLGHLLVSFVPDLDLQQVDFNSDVIDELLDQVLKEVT